VKGGLFLSVLGFVNEDRLQLFPPVRENYLLSVVSKYYVPYQSDGRIGLSAA